MINENPRKKRMAMYGVDLALIVGTLIVLLVIVGYARPLVIAPLDDFETTETQVLFEFEKGSVIWIDDNIEFTSPQKYYAEDDLVISLEPGKYYWKVEGILQSEIRSFEILSKVDLRVRESGGELYEVVNAGNVDLDVEVYYQDEKIGDIVLEREQRKESEGDKFIGGRNE
jgi:hypothetical protein